MKGPKHAVIYTGGGGRLGNQLIRFAHWMAWARAQGGDIEVINLAFWPFAQYFAAWNENPGCVFPLRSGGAANLSARVSAQLPDWLRSRLEWRWQSVVQETGRWWPRWQSISLKEARGDEIDLDSPQFAERVNRSRVTTCRGWKIAGWELFSQQQKELRGLFRPAARFLEQGHEFMTPLRERYDVIAGLLIRQTDYRAWAGGRFFFSSRHYADWIHQLVDLHGRQRVAVVIACDERQDSSVFARLPCYFASGSTNTGGHWFKSFVELSLCDFVLSPPSTFSAAAAFVGSIPLWPLADATQELSPEQLMPDSIVEAARHPVFSAAVK